MVTFLSLKPKEPRDTFPTNYMQLQCLWAYSETNTGKGRFWTTGLDWFVHGRASFFLEMKINFVHGRAVVQLLLAHNSICSLESHPSLHLQRKALPKASLYSPISAVCVEISLYEEVLPSIDVFVCTADPQVEPPLMVINTVLSLMAYNYPSDKLNIYPSDDGGSDLMFYALLEASRFSEHWLPFCRKLKIEPRSPAAYFAKVCEPTNDAVMANEWSSIKVHISKLVVKIALLQ
ncbi:LOW QUALITY PROTEIN: hypothetical protein RJ639_045438, partial [Escallonia herrerae]